jgi:hypothetical protein
MVTHGYVIFKYKGIYYTFYNHSDSYFEHLGNLVVNEINSMINKNAIRYCKNLLLRIPLKGNEEGEMHIYDFHSLLNYPEIFQYFTSNDEPGCEYTYTIDFDSNKFIANKYGENIYRFNLHDIPLDWYEITQNNSSYDDNQDNHDNETDELSSDDNDAILNKIGKLEAAINKLKLKLK